MGQELEKAYLYFRNREELEGRMLKVQFNPAELEFRTVNLKKSGKKAFNRGKNKPSSLERTDGTGSKVNLTVRLIFDAGETDWPGKGQDVEKQVQGLIGAVRENARDTDTWFYWGQLAFGGVLERAAAEYVMFDRNGKPLRANVDLEICGAAG